MVFRNINIILGADLYNLETQKGQIWPFCVEHKLLKLMSLRY